MASSWLARNSSGTNVSSQLALNANGDPTNLTGVTSLAVSIEVDPRSAAPTDQYVLTYDGTAKVSVSGATIVSQTAGKVVFNYTGSDTAPSVYVTFTGLSTTDPVGDVHMVRADQVDLYNSGELFNPDFVAKVSQWGVVRFMDWGDTNSSDAVSWATRSTLTEGSWSKTTTTDGVPLEAMVQLANEAHVDMWYNVPTKADNTYVTNALTYIRDHLDPTLKVHVEWSNEVWNGGFASFAYAQSKANALWGNGSTVSHGANIYYGYRSAQIADIAHKVFTGTHAGQVVDVLAGQAANSGLLTYMLQGVAKAGVGSASSLFQDYAIAPYFGGELSGTGDDSTERATLLNWANSGSAGLDAAFHELEYGGTFSSKQSLADVNAWITSSAAAAKSAGLNLVAYEGGASLDTVRFPTADQATAQAFFSKLLNDPRMGDLYSKLLADFKAAGGTEFLAFNDVSGSSTSGYYGALDSIYDTSSPRYDALLAAMQTSETPAGTSPSNVPSSGNDQLVATSAGGTINALAGDDVITAGTASDTIDGGDGNDKIIGSSGTVDANGVHVEQDYYYGGAGADTITGGEGNDHIYGNEATSAIGAPDGGDSLSGGAGSDAIRGNAGNDTIDGGDGNDWIYGGEDNDSLTGGADKDYIQGDTGNDFVSGGSGNDTLRGGSGDDTVQGGDGNDLLMGDSGHDLLTGGAGNDQFSFTAGQATFATSGTTAYVMDEITDFTIGADKLSLGFHPADVLHGSATSVANAVAWATSALQAHAGTADVAAVVVGTDTYLFYDDAGLGGPLDSGIHLDNVNGSLITTSAFV